MHQNRTLYTLPEYQEILRQRYQRYGLLLHNAEKKQTFAVKPIPSTPFLPEGRKKYFKKLYKRAHNINFNKKYTFCTLTYSLTKYTPSQAAMRIKHDLDLFFKRLNYRKSKPEYFYVIELTENMMVHIHLIFDRYVHKKKIFKSWFKVTGCTAIKIKSKKYKEAVHYCLKYLTKSKNQSVEKWAFIYGHIDRLWTCSRKFFLKSDNQDKHFYCLGFGSNDLMAFSKYYDDVQHDEKTRLLKDSEAEEILYYLQSNGLLYYVAPDDLLRACGIFPENVNFIMYNPEVKYWNKEDHKKETKYFSDRAKGLNPVKPQSLAILG